MGIYIKRIKMPKSCVDCDMLDLSGAVECDNAYDTKNSEWGRALNCPLVNVPPHGKCIDADALKAEGWVLQMYRHDEYGCSIICRSLDSEDIPAILTAESEEE